jgi:hypothetical protein
MKTKYSQEMSSKERSNEGLIQIGLAMTPEEKKEIYRFRYITYVEEMSKRPQEADYDNKMLYDELDKSALLLYAKVGSDIIATKRINIGTLSDFPPDIADFLSLKTFQDCNNQLGEPHFAFITKLMVAPAYRGSPVLYLLMAKCYEICCLHQVQFIFGICHFHLLRLYENMGCRRYYKNFFLPGHGLAIPIVLLADDIQHLRKVRSPLFRAARKRKVLSPEAVAWFEAVFANNLPTLNSQIITEEELWTILCQRLNCLPTKVMNILQTLSETEAKNFLHNCGVIVQCNPDDIITFQGDVSYTYNILISGKLRSLTFLRPVREYATHGQLVGANGLTEHNKQLEDIAAVTSAEILVLSGVSFQKYRSSHPDTAHKIIRNIIDSTRRKPFRIE